MVLLLLLAFVVLPLVEIAVILRVGAIIGTGWTVLLLVADSVLGAWLLRREGTRAWRELRASLGDGQWPGDAVANGAMILVGGTLLVTPGFVTDLFGFVLLLAPGRRVVLALLRTGALTFLFGPRAAGAWKGTARARRAAGTWNRSARAHRAVGDSRARTSSGEVLDVEVVEIHRERAGDDSDGGTQPGGNPRPDAP
ncbi:MAG: FxsA family protein [Nitriliruptoraceae bacterium]